MADDTLSLSSTPEALTGRIGVIDIGSNTVRLVVYDVPDRMPIPMFNEKSECRLVEGLSDTGKLSDSGVERAIASLRRFIALSDAMDVDVLDLIATAAVREASDGDAFTQRIQSEFGVDVVILSGAEEAELSAVGLLAGVPDADGVLGDLGGGSLDLVGMLGGSRSHFGTAPLGHVRLREACGGKVAKAPTYIRKHLESNDWLGQYTGRNLYLSGGIMRAMARVFIQQTGYPLHVVDNYMIRPGDALRLTTLLANLSADTLKKIPAQSPSRLKSLPFAATVLKTLIEIIEPETLVFSGFGMREGQMLRRLPAHMRSQDPLIAGAERLAERTGRFLLSGHEIANWISPIFPDAPAADERRMLAACLLSDIGWSEHPDYRAEHAFYRCLRLPFSGLSHADRVFVATSVYVRYNGDPDAPLVNSVRGLLEPEQLAKVDGIGRAIRLAHTLSGSAPGLLRKTHFERKPKSLILHMPGEGGVFRSETVERRFRSLAKVLGLRGSITFK